LAVPRGVEPPTFGLGNRFGYRYFNDLRPNVANVLHTFPHREILIACPQIRSLLRTIEIIEVRYRKKLVGRGTT
jgi:hypothetical protein